MEKYINRESNGRVLWYEQDFRNYLKEHNKLPKEILKLSDGVWHKGEVRCSEGICLECIDLNLSDEVLFGRKDIEQKDIYSKGFKVTVGDKTFFFKIEKKYMDTDGGYEEMQDTILAKDIIEPLKEYNVRVVNPLLGYKDDERSYYISEWENLPLLDVVLYNYDKKGLEKYDILIERMDDIRNILDGYREVSAHNMFYDEDKDEIVLFDLHL
jgi:hypothetical protein